jgi:hypothetical protein
MSDTIDTIDKNKGEFIHFYDNKKQCTNFIKYAKGLNYKVSHICCNGTGCRIDNIDDDTAFKLKENFLQK